MRTIKRIKRINQVLKKRQPDLQVVLEGLRNPHNISAILRTCDAVGIQYVKILEKSKSVAISKDVARGSHQWLDISFYDDVSGCVSDLRNQGIKIYVTTLASESVDFREVDYKTPCAVWVGSELRGVSRLALEMADESIMIPMAGFVQSFNVSVAAAIILYEAFRQRDKAGMYEGGRLLEQEKEKILSQWFET